MVTPVFIGSIASVVTFCAIEANSLACSCAVSKCLRAWEVETSRASDTDFAAMNSLKKSKAALVLRRAVSISLRPYSVLPLVAAA